MADILIVDDDVELAAVESDVLVFAGHRTRIAYDGEAGLAALKERLPDVILLDIEMPVLDGPGMAHEMIVADAGRELIPIVLTSGYSRLAEVAARIGTPYSIAKPCGAERLIGLTGQALRERQAPLPGRDEHHGLPPPLTR